jgi:antirestriction protein ArdC
MGFGRGQGAARYAAERRNRAALFRHQRADPVGRRDTARFSRPELAHLPPGAVAGRQCPGEHGTTVVYADRFTPEDEKRRARETGEDAAAIPFLKRFTVFNAAQCDGLPEASRPSLHPPPGLIEPRVETLIQATGIDFRIGGDRAFYVPAHDYVQVPPPQAISSRSTGTARPCTNWGTPPATSRLGRDLTGGFGTRKYAFEELVAEINAAFCCASLGITPTVRHADYIGSWLEVLREDNRAIVRAASQASKAADWLLGLLPEASSAPTSVRPTTNGRRHDRPENRKESGLRLHVFPLPWRCPP